MKRQQPEFLLHCVVADYFRKVWPNLLWFHCGNGEKRNAITGARLKRMGVRPGVADILIFWPEGMGAIELKVGKNSIQESQKQFYVDWIRAGGQYAICRSLDEVMVVIKQWGVR